MLSNNYLRFGRLVFVSVSVFVVITLLLPRHGRQNIFWWQSRALPSSRNATLGFGAIYVLTEDDTTWRAQGLPRAAKLTGVRLSIPVQRHLSDESVFSYLSGDDSDTVLNEICALLNSYVDSGHETALFLEDDVDFGVDIKPQMEILSEMLQGLYLGQRGMSDQNLENEAIQAIMQDLIPYSYAKDIWEVLWVGHYGVEFTENVSIISYDDPYALPWERLTSNFNNYYEAMRPDLAHPEQ